MARCQWKKNVIHLISSSSRLVDSDWLILGHLHHNILLLLYHILFFLCRSWARLSCKVFLKQGYSSLLNVFQSFSVWLFSEEYFSLLSYLILTYESFTDKKGTKLKGCLCITDSLKITIFKSYLYPLCYQQAENLKCQKQHSLTGIKLFSFGIFCANKVTPKELKNLSWHGEAVSWQDLKKLDNWKTKNKIKIV